jgi:hypothetical protein
MSVVAITSYFIDELEANIILDSIPGFAAALAADSATI